MKLLDPYHPFLLPLWRRIVIVIISGGWAGVEAYNGNTAWAVAFGAAALYCAYHFFIGYDPAKAEAAAPAPRNDDE